jgi:hypothetical protein
MAVDVSTTPTFSAGRPRKLWKRHYSHGMSSSCGAPGATSSNFDVTADGKRFLMIKDDDQDSATSKQIVVVLGWADELNRICVSRQHCGRCSCWIRSMAEPWVFHAKCQINLQVGNCRCSPT